MDQEKTKMRHEMKRLSVLSDLVQLIDRVPDELFYSRHDPEDIRLGDIVSPSIDDYQQADIVILGCPQDEGVRRNQGRSGAAEAPSTIRKLLYRFPATKAVKRKHIVDIGDIRTDGSLEDIHGRHAEVVGQLLRDGKRIITIGGGNDVSYADGVALAKSAGKFLAFNIDSHFDVRNNSRRNSGTPYRQLLDEGHLDAGLFYEMAAKDFLNSPDYHAYLEDKGVQVYTLDSLREKGIEPLLESILSKHKVNTIFWGIDFDAVQATDAPGVSAPCPIGLTADEICSIAKVAARDPRSRVFEITEVNPRYDIDNRTSRLAALVLLHVLAA